MQPSVVAAPTSRVSFPFGSERDKKIPLFGPYSPLMGSSAEQAVTIRLPHERSILGKTSANLRPAHNATDGGKHERFIEGTTGLDACHPTQPPRKN